MTVRRFKLERDEDETGVSGTGHIADGALFEDGTAVVRWRTETASTTLFDDIEDVLAVHGHGGKTRLVFIDAEEGESEAPPRGGAEAARASRGAAQGRRRFPGLAS